MITGKELIKFIQDNHMEKKSVHCLMTINGGIVPVEIEQIALSCPEDDCVWLDIDITDIFNIEFENEAGRRKNINNKLIKHPLP